jgi:hypothetical protein
MSDGMKDGGEQDGSYLSGRTWITCMDGFQTRSTPSLDLLRLGMLCGPYHAMRRLGEPLEGKLSAGASQKHAFEAKRDQCFRLFAVAEPSLKRFSLRAFGPASTKIAETTVHRPFAALGADGVFCVQEAGSFQWEIESVDGQGSYAAQMWLLP